MAKAIRIYEEAMELDESQFISSKYKAESKLYLKTMNIFLVLATISPLAFCIFLIFSNSETTYKSAAMVYLVGLAFMLFFVGIIATVSYYVKLNGLSKDAKHRIKIIEKANIKQKKEMRMNNTFHFYLDSPTQYTIEVSKVDFNRFTPGDEINIEYGKYSKEYFGYF